MPPSSRPAPPSFPISAQNRVRQIGRRGQYDRSTIHAVLDAGFVAHVAFVVDDAPCVIPMTYGRDGDRLYLHGSRTSRIATTTRDQSVSLGVTVVDGIVVGRSMFETSMNYRAVVVFGRARWLDSTEERLHALRCVCEHILPGRWDEVRAPRDNELKATAVLAVEIERASAKVRTGPPADDDGDFDASIWAGVIPTALRFGAPVRSAGCGAGDALPPSLARFGTEPC